MITATCDVCGNETTPDAATYLTLTPASVRTGWGINIRAITGKIPNTTNKTITICPGCMNNAVTIDQIILDDQNGFDPADVKAYIL